MSLVLERLERRTNTLYWQDGLLDLFAGLGVLILGLSWVTGYATFGGVAPTLAVPMWMVARKRFTEPRLGLVELGDGRQARNRAFMRLMYIGGIGSFLLGVGVFIAGPDKIPRQVIPALPGVLLGIAAIATAEALQLKRFYLHGAILLLSAVAIALLGVNPGWPFVVGGAFASAVGVVMALRFAKQYPLDAKRDLA